MTEQRQPGPVERELAASARPELRRLCALDNLELLELINLQIEGEDGEYDSRIFHAARALLDERAPLPEEWVPETSREEFVRRYAPWFEGVELPPAPPEREPRRLGGARLARGLIAAVILIAALLSVTAVASQKNPIQYVVDKGEQLVRTMTQGPSGALTIPEGTDTTSQYSTLEEALEDLGAENVQRITWIPERFSLNNIIVQTVQSQAGTMYVISSMYLCDEDKIFYNITHFPQNSGYGSTMEMDPGSHEVMVADGTEYDIVQNIDMAQAQWFKDGYDYVLAGHVSREELKTILRSLE